MGEVADVAQKQSPIITAQGKQAGTNHVLRGLHQVLTYEKVSQTHRSPSPIDRSS